MNVGDVLSTISDRGHRLHRIPERPRHAHNLDVSTRVAAPNEVDREPRHGGAFRPLRAAREVLTGGCLLVLLAQRPATHFRGVEAVGRHGLRTLPPEGLRACEKPVELSLAEIKAMPKQEQITMHNFLQGWPGIAEWGGLSLDDLMKVVKPLSNARFLVFYSFGECGKGGEYYDSHTIEDARHPDSP